MPIAWRELVYDYGFQPVAMVIYEGMSLREALVFLRKWRQYRQEELCHH
jgi:hypothetical protein